MNGTDIINSEAFNSLPLVWKIFFGVIIAIFLAFGYLAAFKGFRTLMVNFFIKVFRIARQEELLMHELFFSRNDFYLKIYRMSFAIHKKTELFTILTKNKVDMAIQLTKDFIKEHNKKFNDYSAQELKSLLFDLRNKITKNSDSLSRDMFKNIHGNDRGNKLWGLIYESENGYKKYWEEKNRFLDKNIERFVYSKSYNNIESVRGILNQIYIAVDLAIIDCEETFEGLNGQITELIGA